IAAGHEIPAVTEQLRDEKPAPHLLEHATQVIRPGADDEIVIAARASGRAHAELARRVAAEKVAFEHAVAHHRALRGRNTLFVVGRAREAAALARPFLDRHV